jgi:hypothetical protein
MCDSQSEKDRTNHFRSEKNITERSCMFCGDHKLTLEDAWPLWLMRLFPTNLVGKMEAQRGNSDLQPWSLANPSLKVKFVCARCNNGWMSQLEDQVKPVVEALLGPKSVFINSQQQSLLAIWSVKNAMVFEALRSDQSWFYSAKERENLRIAFQPPDQTYVWLAKVIEFDGPFTSSSNLGGIIKESTNPVSGYVTTMAFGNMAIQVLNIRLLTSDMQYSNLIFQQSPGPWDQTSLPIWPNQQTQLSWPPTIGLSGEFGLQVFSKRFKTSKIE